METFIEWLAHLDLTARLRLLETYYTFNPAEYNRLFQDELEKVIARTNDPAHRLSLEELRDFDWIAYIAASVRNAGFRDYRAGQEAISDLASKFLLGKLFSGWDERTSGPLILRFKKSVSNGIANMREKAKKSTALSANRPDPANIRAWHGHGRRGACPDSHGARRESH